MITISVDVIIADGNPQVTADVQTLARRALEQAVQHEATISGLNPDKDYRTHEDIDLEDQEHDLTQELSSIQSSDLGSQQEYHVLQSEMAQLKSKNTELEKKLRHSKKKYDSVCSLSPMLYRIGISNTVSQRIRKLKEEVDILRQDLLDQEYAHDNVRARVCSPMTTTVCFVHDHWLLTLSRTTESTESISKVELRSSQRSSRKRKKTRQHWRGKTPGSLSRKQVQRRCMRSRRRAKLRCAMRSMNSVRKTIVLNRSSKTRVTASRRPRTTERHYPGTSRSSLPTTLLYNKSSPAPRTSFARLAPSAPQSGQSLPVLSRNRPTPTPMLTQIARSLLRAC